MGRTNNYNLSSFPKEVRRLLAMYLAYNALDVFSRGEADKELSSIKYKNKKIKLRKKKNITDLENAETGKKTRGRKKSFEMDENSIAEALSTLIDKFIGDFERSSPKLTPPAVVKPVEKFRTRNKTKLISDVYRRNGISPNADIDSIVDIGISNASFNEQLNDLFSLNAALNNIVQLDDLYRTPQVEGFRAVHWEDAIRKVYQASVSERHLVSEFYITNKTYIAKWTNRVSVWWFWRRYVEKILPEDEPIFHKLNDFYGIGKFQKNPFENYGRCFESLIKVWNPLIIKSISFFNTSREMSDDYLSIANLAFLHALEKQAMAIIANAEEAQSIPFPRRLEYAIRKSINRAIPDMTGPYRVPRESEHRKNMPQEISLDVWRDEDNK